MELKAQSPKTRASAIVKRAIAYVPIIGWLRGYDRGWLRFDLIAGLTVWGLMVPAAMGYAQVAGVPPQMGLYAAMAGTLLYPIFGTSRHLRVSTSSTPAIVSATIVGGLAFGDPNRAIELTLILAFVTGCLLLLAGILKLGFLADFMSKSVITGFIFALAITIIIGQLPKVLGIPKTGSSTLEQVFGILLNLDQINPWSLALGAGAFMLILFIKRRYKGIPAALVALALGILLTTVFNLSAMGVQIVGAVPAGLPAFGFNINLFDAINMLPFAAGMVVVLFGESVGAARSYAIKHRYEINPNQELIALGAANLGSSFAQGITIDASLSNTAAADDAGAKTQLASLITGVLILITVIALTPLFYNLPQAVLGAIVIASVLSLLNVVEMKRLYQLRRSDFWLAIISMLGVLLIGVLSGLVIAVLVSLVRVVYRASRPNGAVLGKAPDRAMYGDIARNPGFQVIPGVLIYRLDAALFFANAGLVRSQLRDYARQYTAQRVIIDLAASYSLDIDSIDMLKEILQEFREANVDVRLVHVKSPVRAIMDKTGLMAEIGNGNIYSSVDEALAGAKQPAQQGNMEAGQPESSDSAGNRSP